MAGATAGTAAGTAAGTMAGITAVKAAGVVHANSRTVTLANQRWHEAYYKVS